ncbi:unnamed protein product [Lymnaea stagnalis]|uniref:SET domain-containing protein n=1 Tax=Lymnaea stagnalis TaxID=6523 RepID=A0AAV2IE48_LYMST
MQNLGRCGRSRNHKSRRNSYQPLSGPGVSESHLPEFIRLKRWMKSSISKEQCLGRSIKKLEVAYFKNIGRGLKCKRHIEVGDTIISIPLDLLITTNTVFNSEIGAVILSGNDCFTPQQLLTIFLIIERCKGENSFWFPYLSTLPTVYTTPLYFTNDEIKLLTTRGKQMADEYRKRFDRACQVINNFLKASAPSYCPLVDLADIMWAWSTIETRSVYLETTPHSFLKVDPDESHVALAPYLDLLNHKDTAQMSAGLNTSSSCYEIVTQDKFEAHDQIFICYGAYDNTRLLVNYGFTLPQNVHNMYYITLDNIKQLSPNNIQHWDKKVSIIKETGLEKNLVCNQDGLSWALMTVLKIAALPWELLFLWKSLKQGISISNDNESKANSLATKLVSECLKSARDHLRNVMMCPSSNHFELLKNLAQDDVDILESTLAMLT